MSDDRNPPTEEQIEAYVDGLMSPSEREAFEAQLQAHPEIAAQLELQQRIGAALRAGFPPAKPSAAHLERLLASTGPAVTRRFAQIAVVAAAAALVGVVVAWQFMDRRIEAPFFQPRPVAEVYRETVANGFDPYYECRDDERFAATFEQRQGIVLHLAAMPAGKGMLGLSYPGGLSRDTTAMLCRVDDQPVMVFVDRVENDQPIAGENSDASLRITREVRDNLVFYEVAPAGAASVLEYLVKEKPSNPQAEL
jgi:hypothetical protein